MKGLKQRLEKGEAVIGTFLSLGNPLTSEIVAKAGFDWVLIDLEHGVGSEQDALKQIQAIEHTPVSAIIRVEGLQRQRIHKALDHGAHGIMCPHIDTAAEASLATKAMRYAPEGLRGVAKMVRATNFGVEFNEYHEKQAENLLSVIQIETAKAIDNIDEIAENPEIDVLFIGPADLSMSLGIFGQLDHPKFIEAETKILQAAARHNKTVGFLLFDVGHFQKYYDKGVRFFACGTDALFLSNAAKDVANKLKVAKTIITT